MLQLWNARKENIEHDFAIAEWSLCVMKGVRENVAACINGSHREAIECAIRKLYFGDPRDMDVVINKFWKGFKHWQQKSGNYGVNIGRWLLTEVVRGASHISNERYSLPYYPEVGHVGCRTTSKITGIGPGERAWGDVKHLKTSKRVRLSGDRTEKQAILYTTVRINEARLKQVAMEKIDTVGKDSMWVEDDVK